jgi:predicted metal-dependent peptidase
MSEGQNLGFALHYSLLRKALADYEAAGKVYAVRCVSCANLVTENTLQAGYCPYCGVKMNQDDFKGKLYIPGVMERKIEEMLDGDLGSPVNRHEQNASKQLVSEDALGEAAARSELWEEDEMRAQEINDLIDKMNSWGSIPGNVVQQIQASTKARIDYRKIMQGFRASVLSNKMRLTRMRPNRRTGFQQMGSVRRFDTKLLVAVDVSGSISDKTLSHFYSVINKFFKYGINEIDCVQFDYDLGEVKPIRKASRTVQIFGRGGTSFQPIFDYLAEHNIYDGLIILTDGGAPHPKMDDSIKANILWVCEDENSYNLCKDWMQLYGRVCWMYL